MYDARHLYNIVRPHAFPPVINAHLDRPPHFTSLYRIVYTWRVFFPIKTIGYRSECVKATSGTPDSSYKHDSVASTSAVWVATAATPLFMVNASQQRVLLGDFQEESALQSIGNNPTGVGPTMVHWWEASVEQLPESTVTVPRLLGPPMALVVRHMSSFAVFHDSFGAGAHEDDSYKFRWKRYRHEPLRLPDQFMARFLHTLMYLAEVVTADVVSACLFGRSRPRYYQRARRNRFRRRRRRRLRRFATLSTNARVMLRNTWIRAFGNSGLIDDDVSGPAGATPAAAPLVSTSSAAATSRIASTAASAEHSALVSTSVASPAIPPPERSIPEAFGTRAKEGNDDPPQAVPSQVALPLPALETSGKSSPSRRQSPAAAGLHVTPPALDRPASIDLHAPAVAIDGHDEVSRLRLEFRVIGT